MIAQTEILLNRYSRGFHLITSQIEKNLPKLPEKGIVNIFIEHTSAAIAINENADPSVRYDFNSFINRLIPDGDPFHTHTLEGEDDMPAHIKSSIFGQSITIPIKNFRMALGTWQGIYLCEFRDDGGQRRILITIIGE
jgi:secondary thiamine-phosphate synthase enzyme